MTYDCGSCMMKYVLCAFNFIIFLLGSIVLSVGIWLLVDKNSFIGLMQIVPVENIKEFTSAGVIGQASYLLIAVGVFIFLVSFLGYCGALKESKCMLMLYAILLIVILALEIAAGVLTVSYKPKAEEETKNLLKLSIAKYYNSTDHKDAITLAWDALQVNLKCCGVDSYEDYQKSVAWEQQNQIIPVSCCALNSDNKPLQPTCINEPTESNSYYKIGCYNKIMEWIMTNLNIIIIIAAVLGLIEVLGILFACCLTKQINVYTK